MATANFDYEKQEWYIESPVAMDIVMKTRVVNFLKIQYNNRLKGEIGERKRRMQEAISKLSVNTLSVRLVGKGEKTLYLDPSEKL